MKSGWRRVPGKHIFWPKKFFSRFLDAMGLWRSFSAAIVHKNEFRRSFLSSVNSGGFPQKQLCDTVRPVLLVSPAIVMRVCGVFAHACNLLDILGSIFLALDMAGKVQRTMFTPKRLKFNSKFKILPEIGG